MGYSSLGALVSGMLPKTHDWQTTLLHEWKTIVGDLHQHMCLKKITGSTAIIGVYDSHWLHELYMLGPTIIETMNTHLGAQHITQVRFVLGSRPIEKTNEKNQKEAVLAESRPMGARHRTALEHIKDKQLQNALQKLFNKCRT